MVRTVWRYELELEDTVEVAMRKDATIIDVRMQGETPCVWALVDPDGPTEVRTFRLFGTGWPIAEGAGRHVGTVHTQRGLVFHVFEDAA